MSVFTVNQFTGGMNDCIHPGLLDEKTAQLLIDTEIDNGKIKAIKMPEQLIITNPEMFNHFGTRNRNVVKWYERYYWSQNNKNTMPYYGGNKESYLGIPYPLIQPTLTTGTPEAGEKGLTGDYRYCMTYVNVNGWESACGALGDYWKEITLSNNTVTVTDPGSWPDDISYIKVYRTTDKGADFYHIGNITTEGGTLKDASTSDIDLVFLSPLTAMNNYPAPEGGKYLTENGGVFYLAVGDRLYFSVVGNPHGWHPLQWIGIGDTITGITPEFQGVLVFTRNNTYRITGAENIATVTKVLIPGNQGCINYRTIAHVSNAPIWLSNDGLCLWDGQSIQIISNKVLKTTALQVQYAVSANDAYILFLLSGAIVFDKRNGGVFRKLSFTCEYAWYDSKTDKLYLQKNGNLYEFGTGIKTEWTYVSPYIGGSDLALKRFDEILFTCSAVSKLSVYIEGVKKHEISIQNSGRQRIKLPLSTIGRYVHIQLQSKGELSELAVTYK